MNRNNLRHYQEDIVSHIKSKKKVLLAVDMGLGKTPSVLTAIQDLLDSKEAKRVLVIAPKRVANSTWPEEIKKWDHIKFKYSLLTGTQASRIKEYKNQNQVDIINRENFPWLCEKNLFNYDMLVWDESSSLKAAKRKTQLGKLSRYGWLAKVSSKLKYCVLLSGTPTPERIEGLYGQIYPLDQGQSLGKYKSHFYQQYFYDVGRNFPDYRLRAGAEKEILEKCKNLMVGLKTEDYLELPEVIFENSYVELKPKHQKIYKEMKKKFVVDLEENKKIISKNSAVLCGKLQQIANGAIYDESHNANPVHEGKIECLQTILEKSEDENLLVFYHFEHDKERLLKNFPEAVVLKDEQTIQDWNAGKIKMLLAHPASAAHGLNLQNGGRIIVWFSMVWSYEQYQQAIKRLHRSGQTNKVIVIHILAKGTIDELILKALQEKDTDSKSVINKICNYTLEEYEEYHA